MRGVLSHKKTLRFQIMNTGLGARFGQQGVGLARRNQLTDLTFRIIQIAKNSRRGRAGVNTGWLEPLVYAVHTKIALDNSAFCPALILNRFIGRLTIFKITIL